jgi:hypothetical protein
MNIWSFRPGPGPGRKYVTRIAAAVQESKVFFLDGSRGVAGVCVVSPVIDESYGEGLERFVVECYDRGLYRAPEGDEVKIIEEIRQRTLAYRAVSPLFSKEEKMEWLCEKFDQAFFEDSGDSDNPVRAHLLSSNSGCRTVQFTIDLQETADTPINLGECIQKWMEQGL